MKYIVSKPQILAGTPVIKGTRIPVSRIYYLFQQGYNNKEIQEEYPQLTKEKVNYVLGFTAKKFNQHYSLFVK